MQHLEPKKSDELLKLIGSTLKKLREDKNLSMTILAYENDLQKSMISRLESGKNEPKLFSLWCLLEALGMKMSDFMKLIEEELPEDWRLLEE